MGGESKISGVEPSRAERPEGIAQPLRPQTVRDLLFELRLIGEDYPNYAEMPVNLPCGHWREIAAHFHALSPAQSLSENTRGR